METAVAQTRDLSTKTKRKTKDQRGSQSAASQSKTGPSKLRGLEKDAPDVRISKTMSYLLRHNASGEGISMRPDGYVKVSDLLSNSRLTCQNVDLAKLQELVAKDSKKRYDLKSEPEPEPSSEEIWWIRANQGHSIKSVQLELKPINDLSEIPTGMAVHGTMKNAWSSISSQGLSKMKRNHIHLAQGVSSDQVISGMRKNCQIFIYIDVAKAMNAGIKFFLSDNGVVLSGGDEQGFIPPQFFLRAEDSRSGVLPGWEEDRFLKEDVDHKLEGLSI